MSQEDRKYYIEFRVYLEDKVDEKVVATTADQLHEVLTDLVTDEHAPPIFTQDVTYEITLPEKEYDGPAE